MAVRKRDISKVVVKGAADTFLDVRIVHKYSGLGRSRKIDKSEYGVFHSKHRVAKEGFNKPELAVDFIEKNIGKYNKKHKKFD